MQKAVVIYSGGMDSFTLLHHVLRAENVATENVIAVSVDYDQRHKRELTYAMRVCEQLDVPHFLLDMGNLAHSGIFDGSALTYGQAVPHGHYAEETMKATVVPNRNMLLISLAVALAEAQGAGHVYYGAHSGDHDIYPDCRPGFVAAMNRAAMLGTYQGVTVNAPFLNMHKGSILAHARDNLGLVAEDYALTWTCYEGKDQPCGRCGSCTERLEGFAYAGWTDPLNYR